MKAKVTNQHQEKRAIGNFGSKRKNCLHTKSSNYKTNIYLNKNKNDFGVEVLIIFLVAVELAPSNKQQSFQSDVVPPISKCEP